jgi:transcriptional regulator with XRE-family HTH domain
MQPNTEPDGFAGRCRLWRRSRRLSQFDLALTAQVSQRHLSWLETGRSQPSREMVIRLADAMEIPLRERNDLLLAAGYSPLYRETALDAPAMAPVLDALQRVLDHHEPMPSIVVDRQWGVRRTNKAAARMLEMGNALTGNDGAANDGAANERLNLAELTIHENGWRRLITNWDQIAVGLVLRLRRDAAAAPDEQTKALLNGYADQVGDLPEPDLSASALLPVMTLQMQLGDTNLSMFTVITTFGTPQDITTDELRIESFYPSDDATREFFEQLAQLEL